MSNFQLSFSESISTEEYYFIPIYILALLYCCFGLAIVCDVYFVPALQKLSAIYDLPPDIVGSTLMALGASVPELFASLIGVFVTEDDIGTGSIIGSSCFNLIAVPAACAFVASSSVVTNSNQLQTRVTLNAFPVLRNLSFYVITVFVLILVIQDNVIELSEATILLLFFIMYMTFMAFSVTMGKNFNYLVPGSVQSSSVSSSISGNDSNTLLLTTSSSSSSSPTNSSRVSVEECRQNMPKIINCDSNNTISKLNLVSSLSPNNTKTDQTGIDNTNLADKQQSQQYTKTFCKANDKAEDYSSLNVPQKSINTEYINLSSNNNSYHYDSNITCSVDCSEDHNSRRRSRRRSIGDKNFVSERTPLLSNLNSSPHTVSMNGIDIKDNDFNNQSFNCRVNSFQRPNASLLSHVCLVSMCQSGNQQECLNEVNRSTLNNSIDVDQFKTCQQLNIINANNFNQSVANTCNQEQIEDSHWYCSTWISILMNPILICMKCLTPLKFKTQNWTIWTFLVSIVLIGLLTYISVWSVSSLGRLLGIPESIAGMTILSWGTGIPELIASIVLIKKTKHADMAICNTIGSNVIDITFCLSIPWIVKCLMNISQSKEPIVRIQSFALPWSCITLLITVIALVIILRVNSWELNWQVGLWLLIVYAMFVVSATLIEFYFSETGLNLLSLFSKKNIYNTINEQQEQQQHNSSDQTIESILSVWLPNNYKAMINDPNNNATKIKLATAIQ